MHAARITTAAAIIILRLFTCRFGLTGLCSCARLFVIHLFPLFIQRRSAAAQAAGLVPAWVFVLALAWAPGSAFVSAGLSAFASLMAANPLKHVQPQPDMYFC